MAPTIRAEGAFYSASGQARISQIDVRDIAAVAVALTTDDHDREIYTLSGPEALTYDEVADELSKVLGRVIRHVSLPAAYLRAGMLAEELPDAIADRMLDLERYFREGHADAITDDVKRVIGREPKRFTDYVRDTAPTRVWNADAASAARLRSPRRQRLQ
jgi:uncharacterized protein YbjT (DUF2867 family)